MMKIEVTKYRKPDGYLTRYWSVKIINEMDRCTRDAQDLLLIRSSPPPACGAGLSTA
jgi:hypothetical protein